MRIRNEPELAPGKIPRAPVEATAWEYRSALMERDADLSQYGSEGWECYAVTPQPADMAMFYFRRRR